MTRFYFCKKNRQGLIALPSLETTKQHELCPGQVCTQKTDNHALSSKYCRTVSYVHGQPNFPVCATAPTCPLRGSVSNHLSNLRAIGGREQEQGAKAPHAAHMKLKRVARVNGFAKHVLLRAEGCREEGGYRAFFDRVLGLIRSSSYATSQCCTSFSRNPKMAITSSVFAISD